MTTQTQTMTTQEVADRLVELCRAGEFEQAQRELFADDAVSIEPYATEGFDKETTGLDAIIEKGKKWADSIEQIHESSVSEPLITGNTIAFTLFIDCTSKKEGRMKMSELCVYHVKDGKIVAEQFFV
jgi:hypothetical protein